jgi:probable rRNA maturation factor
VTASELVVHVNRVESAAAVSHDDVVRAVRAVADAEAVKSGEISITFLDPLAIAALNEAHLERQGPTDVIAFNLAELSAPLADIYICPAIARQSATEYGVDLREELLRLIVHGMLHVVGYDHPEGEGRLESEMYRRQEDLLGELMQPGEQE